MEKKDYLNPTIASKSLMTAAAIAMLPCSSEPCCWLDTLEKEFDKSFIDLDLLLSEIDADQLDMTCEGRQRLGTMSGAFAQLVHKVHTLQATNQRMHAEMRQLRQELVEGQASNLVAVAESSTLMRQVHSLQCQLLANKSGAAALTQQESEAIKKKIEQELEIIKKELLPGARILAENGKLRAEINILRTQLDIALREMFGSRLAAKYLDKELAGRIQQIQLLGQQMKNVDASEHERLWAQLEAEIHLHRHKTVIRACRGRRPLPMPSNNDDDQPIDSSLNCIQRNAKHQAKRRIVTLYRDASEGLGISVTGGREHGVPILISDLHLDTPAIRCGQIYVGDAILGVNGQDLRQASHAEAVHILSEAHGQICLELAFLWPDRDSDDEDDCNILPFKENGYVTPSEAPSSSTASTSSIGTNATTALAVNIPPNYDIGR